MFFNRILAFRGFSRSVENFKHRSLIRTIKQSRNFAVTSMARSKSMKVAVLGAAGPTGSCLSLFLKQSPLIDELAIYDKAEVASLALELSHIDTKCRLSYLTNNDEGLRDTLEDAKIVMITVGLTSCNEGKSLSDVLLSNAKILLDCVPHIVKYCPTALIGLVTNPVNHLVPLIIEIYKKYGVYNHNRIFGITTLDCMRANTFAAEITGLEPECVMVPVIGGNCSKTCVPIFSQMKPCRELTNEEISKLTYSVRMAEEEVTREYNGKGTSSLSMGFAAARFCTSLCKALRDERGVVECAYTRSCVIPEVTYFAGPLELGPSGVQRHLGVPPLTPQECKILALSIPHLREAIKLGETLVLGPHETSTEICPTIPNPDLCNQEISASAKCSFVCGTNRSCCSAL